MAERPAELQKAAAQQPQPLRLSRVFHAPRATVFAAWSSAAHVRQWFCPDTFVIPAAEVEMRVGGKFDVCMRSPQGEEHWIRGRFVEITPHTRLVIDMHCADSAGRQLFRAYTEVDFADALGGTRMAVLQTYTLIDPATAWMVAGAPEGWRTSLDRLERQVLLMQGAAGTGARSVVHAEFALERSYQAPVARVWKAFTDESAKQKWFAGTPGSWQLLERRMDVRVGGSERLRGRWQGGVVSTFDAVYHDVIPNERLVYSYVMHLDDRKISVSLATIELRSAGGKTNVKVTEQGAFLDGYEDGGSRERGTGHLLDALGESLKD
jgi:uncharacterized protein YndB with AHSA1/START domain